MGSDTSKESSAYAERHKRYSEDGELNAGLRTLPEFRPIPDSFKTIEEVSSALRMAGLETSQLIVGVDFTKSNTWNGEKSFNGKCLHDIDGPPNPYFTALSLIAETLAPFDNDNRIPCYGFGDSTAKADSVFSFHSGDEPCIGLRSMLHRYNHIAPLVELSGPTSFAPLIYQAMRIVYSTNMEFHLLLIVADGQLSGFYLEETKAAIIQASHFPISIVLVGVGDGPWDLMNEFDDRLPERKWDNFQFVEFSKIVGHPTIVTQKKREVCFALNALMELPEQYNIAQRLTGISAKAKVQHIIERIPNHILIDPPLRFDEHLSVDASMQ